MKNLLITSINPGVGKSTFTLALAMKLKEDGMNVGYFKPITDSSKDTDAADAKQLLEMKEDLSVINPVLVSVFEYDMKPEQIEETKSKIQTAFKTLSESYELLVIEGCRKVNYLAFLGLSALELSLICNARILLVSSGEEIEDADRLLLGKSYLGDKLIGGAFTLVPDQLIQHFESFIIPHLKSNYGIEVFGLIPSRTDLVAPTVTEIQSALGAQVLSGDEHLNNLVEDFVVGAMEPEAALKYFRKSVNKAVITGGDRPRIALAAMETDTSVVILTGSILPPVGVLARSEEKGIPILLVAQDTF
ncbi:MAG: DRTGG domain-containing protein, partial [Candidatus Kariarchaeaceae archaeon]